LAVPVRNVSAPGFAEELHLETDRRALVVSAALLFVVGFVTRINNILVPRIFEHSRTQAEFAQLAFFSAYLVFSYPGGLLVERTGYKRAMVLGLGVMAMGAVGFILAAELALFPVFLAALVVLGAGMAVVQVAVNPYVTVMGHAATAPARLNFVQGFNAAGMFLGPLLGAFLLTGNHTPTAAGFAAHTAPLPYLALALLLLFAAIALAATRLRPRDSIAERTQDFRPGAFAEALAGPGKLMDHPWLLAATLGIFLYVGAEVTLGSLLADNALAQAAGLTAEQAARGLLLYWGGAMLGRFAGAALLARVRPGRLLAFAGGLAIVLLGLATANQGELAWLVLPAAGLCNSIMFPTLFALGVQDLGPLTSKGSRLMIMAIVGGAAVPYLTTALAGAIGMRGALLAPVLCYFYVAAFGVAALRRAPGSDALLPPENL